MSLPRALFVSLRPHQWLKNLVVLAALVFSKHLFDAEALAQAVLAFAVFCALAGAVYLVNDLADLERDRLHPAKRMRPLASGELSPNVARASAALLFVAALAAAWKLGAGFLVCALAYPALGLAYSLGLKHVVIPGPSRGYPVNGVIFMRWTFSTTKMDAVPVKGYFGPAVVLFPVRSWRQDRR